MLQPYRPSNRVSALGTLFLLLMVLCGGLVLGGIAFALSRILWLIVVFPIGFGLIGGIVLGFVISKQKIRFPALALMAGIAMGAVIFGVFQYGDYFTFQSEMRQILSEQENIQDVSMQNQAIDFLVKNETGYSGFFGYIKLMAQEGVSIGKFGQSQITLNEPLTWAYWLIELSLIAGTAAIIAREAGKKPFCESCQEWYKGGEHLGSVPNAQGQQFLAYLEGGNFRQASALVVEGSTSFPSLEVYLQRCRHQEAHPSIFVVRETSVDAKGKTQFKDIVESVVSAYEASEITRGLTKQQTAAVYPATSTM